MKVLKFKQFTEKRTKIRGQLTFWAKIIVLFKLPGPERTNTGLKGSN